MDGWMDEVKSQVNSHGVFLFFINRFVPDSKCSRNSTDKALINVSVIQTWTVESEIRPLNSCWTLTAWFSPLIAGVFMGGKFLWFVWPSDSSGSDFRSVLRWCFRLVSGRKGLIAESGELHLQGASESPRVQVLNGQPAARALTHHAKGAGAELQSLHCVLSVLLLRVKQTKRKGKLAGIHQNID